MDSKTHLRFSEHQIEFNMKRKSAVEGVVKLVEAFGGKLYSMNEDML